MSEKRKDHSVATGTGALAGAVAGAAVGSAVGPVGTLLGAGVGAVAGAKAGDEVAEWANPTQYESELKDVYQNRPYYKANRSWDDYQTAYKYSYDTYGQYRGQRFEDVESTLERDWEVGRPASRMGWNEARHAVRDGWDTLDRNAKSPPQRTRR